MSFWLSALRLSVRPSAGSRGDGWLSWKEIKQVFKPAWQAVKMLPGFCRFCRKCHTPPSWDQQEMLLLSCECIWDFKNFPGPYLQKLLMTFTNWKFRGKRNRSIKKFCFKTSCFFSKTEHSLKPILHLWILSFEKSDIFRWIRCPVK